jgi:glycerol kinase
MTKDSVLIGAIDQGTSSTRFLVFSAKDFQVKSFIFYIRNNK